MKAARFIKLLRTGKATAEQVEKALRRGTDPNAPDKYGNIPLTTAAACCSPEIITTLLQAGADIHHKMRKWSVAPLMVAAACNPNSEVMATLLKAGADPNEQDGYGYTPLVWWFQNCKGYFDYFLDEKQQLAVVARLLKAGANPNALPYHPLGAAASGCEYPEVIQTLLQAGANLHETNNDNRMTPLMWAATNNRNPAILATLIEAGLQIDERDNRGWTPLMCAAGWNGNPEIVKFLLEAGGEIDDRDSKGQTPLMLAARYNRNPQVITVLLKAGADVKLKSGEGKSALEYANENRALSEVLELLEP
jgi:ankyrin repeat protein